MRQGNVAHFGVDEAVQEMAVHHRPAADACANCQVNKRIQPLRRAPLPFAQRRPVYICVKTNWHAQRRFHRSGKIGVGPTRLGRGGDVAKRRRLWIGI